MEYAYCYFNFRKFWDDMLADYREDLLEFPEDNESFNKESFDNFMNDSDKIDLTIADCEFEDGIVTLHLSQVLTQATESDNTESGVVYYVTWSFTTESIVSFIVENF